MFVSVRTTVGIGATVQNVIAGNQYEFAPTRSLVEFGLVASATGLVCDVLIGQRAVITNMPVTVQRAANQFAVYPDEFKLRAAAAAGERIIIRVANPTAGALDLFTDVRYNPR